MNAHKFVAEKGIDEAKGIISNIPAKYMECYYSTLCWCTKTKKYSDRFKPRISLVNIADLIRVVESVELIDWHGGLKYAKSYLDRNSKKYPGVVGGWDMLKKAIADYELVESYKQEKCEVLDMVDVSPRCEVRNG